MMDVREKLIEILRKPIFPHELVDPTEAVADYLLDNGVTVQENMEISDELLNQLKKKHPSQLGKKNRRLKLCRSGFRRVNRPKQKRRRNKNENN